MKYHIAAVLSCLILTMGTISLADESTDDPINFKLAQARESYIKDITKFSEEFEKAIESKIADARKSGKQEIVDGLKAELEAFNREGAIPSKTPVALRRKRSVIRGKMEAAYETAIKGYTKSGNDVRRKKLEEELIAFQLPEKIAAIKTDLIGIWKVKIGVWNTDLTFFENGKAFETTDNLYGEYTIDMEAKTVTIIWENGIGRWVHKLPIDPKGTPSTDSRGAEFVIIKQK